MYYMLLGMLPAREDAMHILSRRQPAATDVMLKLPWKRGPEWAANGGVFVSITNFEVNRLRHLPGAYLAGLRLRRAWPKMTGAVGLRLWARPWKRRSGA